MLSKSERQNHILQLMNRSNGQQSWGIRELAERFGVSQMTVRRDLQELSENGILRRHHGGAVSTQRKEIGILLVAPSGKYSDPFFNAFLEGVDRKLQELGYRIAYINTRAEVSTEAQVRDLLLSSEVSGIILVGPPLGEESLNYLKANMRNLVGTIDSIGVGYDEITFDGHSGIRAVVDHLVSLGRRRLAFITGRYDQRQQGFVDAVRDHNLPSEEELCVTVPFGIAGWTAELGHQGVSELMQLPEPPDAIVCASDLIAIGAVQWLHQHSFRIPDDVAVTGFDDIPESTIIVPSLTTVHVHKQFMGELAAERVVRRIENEKELPLFIRTPTHLVIRQSSGTRK